MLSGRLGVFVPHFAKNSSGFLESKGNTANEVRIFQFTELGLTKGRGWFLNFFRGLNDFIM